LLSVFLYIGGAHAADNTIVGTDRIFTTSGDDDTMASIGEATDTGFVALRAANPNLNPWAIDSNSDVILPGAVIIPDNIPHNGIVINIGEMRLYDFTQSTTTPNVYTIGVGREGLTTPVGNYHIGRKAANPTWYPTPRMLAEDPTLKPAVPPGPDNPLGKYAMYLEGTQYRIHGTDKPWSLGRRASSGCIRLYAPQIDALFHHATVGTQVHIISEPIKVAVKDGAVYLEAHPDEDMADAYENDYAMDFKIPPGTLKKILNTSGDLRGKLDWTKVRNVLLLRPGYPVKISS
jgi:L,D-transpeptidase ErfK/SrfK